MRPIDYVGNPISPGDLVKVRMNGFSWDTREVGILIAVSNLSRRCTVLWSESLKLETLFNDVIVKVQMNDTRS